MKLPPCSIVSPQFTPEFPTFFCIRNDPFNFPFPFSLLIIIKPAILSVLFCFVPIVLTSPAVFAASRCFNSSMAVFVPFRFGLKFLSRLNYLLVFLISFLVHLSSTRYNSSFNHFFFFSTKVHSSYVLLCASNPFVSQHRLLLLSSSLWCP